ncbi:MAG: zf-HC2 domain-containing protein [Pseudomonadota bacterium]
MDTTHKTVQELLPWFVTETLDGEQLTMVQEHIRSCAQCQSDIAWQRKFQAVYLPSDATPDMDKAFAHLSARLDVSPNTPHPARKQGALSKIQSLFSREHMHWMPWALAAQCAIIFGLAFQFVSPAAVAPAYHVLGASSAGGGNVVVMFRPETRELDLRRILHASDARVVDGPTVTDAYLLSVPDAKLAQAVRQLRSDPAVMLVEPLSQGGVR